MAVRLVWRRSPTIFPSWQEDEKMKEFLAREDRRWGLSVGEVSQWVESLSGWSLSVDRVTETGALRIAVQTLKLQEGQQEQVKHSAG